MSATLTIASIFTMALPVCAAGETVTGYYYTSRGTAGSWISETSHALTSPTLDNICGGDVGVWFYTARTGLQNSFYRSNTRKVNIQLMEDDGTYSDDDLARTIVGTFGTSDNGVYAPYLFQITSTNGAGIEGHSQVELYLKYNVSKDSRDTSTSMPSGIMCYRFWIY